jgi:hypothetical protein
MSAVYNSTLKDARLQLVADLIAGKSAAAATGAATAGQLVIGTSALSGATGVLASFDLPTTPFVVSAGVAVLQGVPLTATAVATGTAAKAEIRNSAGTTIVSGLTVGTVGAHITLPSVSINSGGEVVITAGTIVHG